MGLPTQIAYDLMPSDIALEDTAAYNQYFQTIVTMRDKAFATNDSIDQELYLDAANVVAGNMEASLSDDSTMVNIGPMLDMWEVEGGGSFAPWASEMQDEGLEESFDNIISGESFDLTKTQTTVAKTGLEKLKANLDNSKEIVSGIDDLEADAQAEMTSLWSRYEVLSKADPDYASGGLLFPSNDRWLWWGVGEPKNEIQEEIVKLGQDYRQALNTYRVQPITRIAERDKLEKNQAVYDKALEAMGQLQGE